MRITNIAVLDEFTAKHADTKNAVNKWIDIVEENNFGSHNELKALFPSADFVGNGRYVFNIKGNRYRFVVLVIFVNGLFEIRFCGTHADYDKIKNIEKI